MNMPPPDVEPLPAGPFGLVGAGGVQVVEPPEEQGGVRQVGQGLDPVVDLALQNGGVHPVRGDVGDVEGLHVLAHGAQGGTGRREVGALAGERVVEGHGRCLRAPGGSVTHGSRPVSVRAAALHGGRRARRTTLLPPQHATNTFISRFPGSREGPRGRSHPQDARPPPQPTPPDRCARNARIPPWGHDDHDVHSRCHRSHGDPPPPPPRKRPASGQGHRDLGARRDPSGRVRRGGRRTETIRTVRATPGFRTVRATPD